MKFKGLILSSLTLLAFLAANVQAIDDVGSVKVKEGQSLADLLIEGSNAKEVYANSVGAPATPKVARELQKNKSTLNWSMPSTFSAGGHSAKESRDQAESTSEKSATSDSQTPSAQTGMVNAQGNWFFTLNDSMTRDLALILLQNGGDVYGSGRIKEGNNSVDVYASGTAAGSDLMLNLVSTNPMTQYKLNLTVDQDLASGDYKFTSAGGESWTGTAKGQKTS